MPPASSSGLNFQGLKSLFLKVVIGCLIAAALLAVVSVLAGSFNETFGRSLSTILMIAFHALVSLGFIDYNEKKSRDNLVFFTNVTFIIIIFSFFTSIFSIWEVISGSLVVKLYLTYFVFLFATLHGEVLAKMLGKIGYLNTVIRSNYFFMAAVVLMLLPLIYVDSKEVFSDFYYRGLAALGIIDATLTIVAVILHKLYLQKHPEMALADAVEGAGKTKGKMNPVVAVVLVLLGLQILGSIVGFMFSLSTRY